jgi:hypothetical protein
MERVPGILVLLYVQIVEVFMYIVYEKGTGRHWSIAFSRSIAGLKAGELDKRGMVSAVETYDNDTVSNLLNVYGKENMDVPLQDAYFIASQISQWSTEKTVPLEGNCMHELNDTPLYSSCFSKYYFRWLKQWEYFPEVMKEFMQFLSASECLSRNGFIVPGVQITPEWDEIRRLCQCNKDVIWTVYRGRDRLYAYGLPFYVKGLLGAYWKNHQLLSPVVKHTHTCPRCGRVWAMTPYKGCPVCNR